MKGGILKKGRAASAQCGRKGLPLSFIAARAQTGDNNSNHVSDKESGQAAKTEQGR